MARNQNNPIIDYKTDNGVAGGLAWKLAERLGAQLITLLVAMYLKNLLGPSEYGVINVVTIFITIANVFVTSGFGSALVQKKDADLLDFSTVFYFNIFFSLLLYGVLFLVSPLIADIYEMPVLTPVLRLLGLKIPLAAAASVQQAYVGRKMIFKQFFFSTLTGTIFSGIVGIVTAMAGWGVFAIVVQYLVNSALSILVLGLCIDWRPRLMFSYKRLKGLFSYGWRLLLSGLIETGYTQLRGIIIGLKYDEGQLSLYQNGNEYPQLVSSNVCASVTSVLFPVMSGSQGDIFRVREITRRSIRLGSYIMFPMMLGFGLVASQFFDIFFEKEWMGSVEFCRLACIVYAFWPIHTANLEAMKAIGRSDIYLKLEIIKKLIGLVFLFSSSYISVYMIAFSGVITTLISAFINAFPNKKLLGYGYFQQLCDMMPAVFYCMFMGAVVFAIGFLPLSPIWLLSLKVVFGIVSYLFISRVTGSDSLMLLIEAAKRRK